MQKILDKCKFDKSNKAKNIEHENLSNVFDGQIILEVNENGKLTCPESSLIFLLLDDVLLKKTGWKKHKDNLIADGIITQTDIDNEKSMPGTQTRIQALEDTINNE